MALIILSSLFLLLIVASLPGQFLRIHAIDTNKPEGVGQMMGSIMTLILWPSMNVAIAVGALSMIRLKNYRSAYRAAVLALIPICSPCFVLGIPFGVWAFLVLRRPTVKELFQDT